MEFGYLERLTIQLTAGAALLEDDCTKPHLEFLIKAQREDGGGGDARAKAICTTPRSL